jgi:hypothetical protein
MSWCIWMARNDLIFKGLQPNLQSVHERFKTEFALVFLRAKPRFQQDMSSWIDTTLQFFFIFFHSFFVSWSVVVNSFYLFLIY